MLIVTVRAGLDALQQSPVPPGSRRKLNSIMERQMAAKKGRKAAKKGGRKAAKKGGRKAAKKGAAKKGGARKRR
jgi:hypothetical protein